MRVTTKKAGLLAVAMFCTSLEAQQGDNSPGAGTERFYGQERFTLVGTQSGAESGTWTEHVREWGRTRAEILDMKMSVFGISRQNRSRVVYTGPEIATVDLQTGGVTLTTNPLYSQVVEGMQQYDSTEEFSKAMMEALGGRATGESGNFAGHACEYWELQLGSRSCVTSWGATLHNSTSLAGVTIERTVTEIRMDDGGPDDAFEFDASQAVRPPSLQDIRALMRGGRE